MHEPEQAPKETILATLVMEAQNPASTRSQLAMGMTRLYKAEEYYLDLSSHEEETRMVLSGQILPVHASTPNPKGEVWLRGEVEARGPIGPSGDFRLSLEEAGAQQLEVHLESFVILIKPFQPDRGKKQ